MFGKAFEHFILMEIAAYNSYSELGFDIHYWRTKSGLEVDFVLGRGDVAIEVKGTSRVDNRDLRPLRTFVESYSPNKALVVCNERTQRVLEEIKIIPYEQFLQALWSGDIVR